MPRYEVEFAKVIVQADDEFDAEDLARDEYLSVDWVQKVDADGKPIFDDEET